MPCFGENPEGEPHFGLIVEGRLLPFLVLFQLWFWPSNNPALHTQTLMHTVSFRYCFRRGCI